MQDKKAKGTAPVRMERAALGKGIDMYRIAVCEDDQDNRRQIQELLEERYGDAFLTVTYAEAGDLLDDWRRAGRQMQDILLMDIRFKDVDGIEVVRELQKIYGQVCVIFITGFAEYAEQAIGTEPVHYLIKPVTGERLFQAVDKAMANLRRQEGTMLTIAAKGGTVRLLPGEMIYVESNLHVLEIHGSSRCWTVKMKLEELMESLPVQFVRIHQSFVVNLDYVTAFTGHQMELAGGVKIPVSRARYGQAKERFWEYLRDKV